MINAHHCRLSYREGLGSRQTKSARDTRLKSHLHEQNFICPCYSSQFELRYGKNNTDQVSAVVSNPAQTSVAIEKGKVEINDL